MAKPGPNKGSGGRPRKKTGTHATSSEGYRRITVGAKSKGKQVYEHRAKAGLAGTKGGNSASDKVVHHKNHSKTDNSKGNLRKTTRGKHPKEH